MKKKDNIIAPVIPDLTTFDKESALSILELGDKIKSQALGGSPTSNS